MFRIVDALSMHSSFVSFGGFGVKQFYCYDAKLVILRQYSDWNISMSPLRIPGMVYLGPDSGNYAVAVRFVSV